MRYTRKKKGIFEVIFGSAVNVLIIITALLSIVGFIFMSIYCKNEFDCSVIDYFALNPENILNGEYIWTIFTHIFFHGGFAHLIINMFVLFSLGGLCEKIIGMKRFLIFYLLAGLFAGILSVLLSGFFGFGFFSKVFGANSAYMVGASGAIFGIAGLFVVLLPRLKFMIIFLPFFSLPAYLMVPLVLFITWGASIIWEWPVGNVAHFGGFLAGIIYGFYLRRKYPNKIRIIQRYFS